MNAKKLTVAILIVLAVRYSVLIAWCIGTANAYADMLISGDYTVAQANCDIGEFADNVALSIGFSYATAKNIQAAYFSAHCQ